MRQQVHRNISGWVQIERIAIRLKVRAQGSSLLVTLVSHQVIDLRPETPVMAAVRLCGA
ncbi:hypothetical protein ACIA8E_28465 [Streptomyces sp. NPDC051664]|uniref:hypothetical protein n=1 Tax=Streptomyces sp. NPDC051664 TaxID=3365668 RepID=UPI0037BB3D56